LASAEAWLSQGAPAAERRRFFGRLQAKVHALAQLAAASATHAARMAKFRARCSPKEQGAHPATND
jgi:hypothetical protein